MLINNKYCRIFQNTEKFDLNIGNTCTYISPSVITAVSGAGTFDFFTENRDLMFGIPNEGILNSLNGILNFTQG